MSATEARTGYPTVQLRRANPAPPPRPAPPVPGHATAPRDLSREPSPGSAAQAAPAPGAPAVSAPIVPLQSVAGRALLAVIAIMSFLAALTLGAAVLVRTGASAWQGEIARELTIQVRPAEGRDVEAAVARAAGIARATPGIALVKPFTRAESARLLEPWLGAGVALDDLPVPRLIVVGVADGMPPDLARLRRDLAEVPGASLDDHRAFVERMRTISRTAILLGAAVLGLMLAATVLLVAFATRGAMAANRTIVEVLHFVGAKNRYIAGQFQWHFLWVGLKGAGLGGGAAMALFGLVQAFGGRLGAAADAHDLLFGAISLGPDGYAGIVGVLVLVAAVAAMTSRITVHRTLNTLE